ncbi:MAG: hypothetical protein JO331_04770 [Verrucomicrobia bacterium]|nr:hypothetical protein [Verrucomicrobiota bacterium]
MFEGIESLNNFIVAEAEIAIVSRDLGSPDEALAAARATLETRCDQGSLR